MKLVSNKDIDVSCVVIGHREAHIITATIKSVLRSTRYANECGVRTEILVVLDSPDDDTREVIEGLRSLPVVIHQVKFKDLSRSRNYAVGVAKGQYVAFVDGDDLWSKNWVVDSYMKGTQCRDCVLHPEYNVYFGASDQHVLHHVGMDESDFILSSIYRTNYWTALAFSSREIFEKYPYKENKIKDGFGYEDWTWNVETIANGIRHLVVPGTSHFIRRAIGERSLLNKTNAAKSLPKIYPMYNKQLMISGTTKVQSGEQKEKLKTS
jgi:glycosyltransferase involved in cell wall biosynthesis